jgi:hypothetical protein
MAHKMKTNNIKQHSAICVGHHYTQTNTNNVNKIWALLQTTGSKHFYLFKVFYLYFTSAAQWLKPPGKKRGKDGIARYFTRRYVLNNLRKVFFFLWYVLTNITFGIYAAWNYRKSNGFIIAARICGMNLNFNCMFILVLMLRKSLTYLRMTKIALFLPIDQHILFHKMVGVMIAVYSIVHTLAHFGNASE